MYIAELQFEIQQPNDVLNEEISTLKLTNLAIKGKQPQLWPPARRGQSLSQASLKDLFHKSMEKFPCS